MDEQKVMCAYRGISFRNKKTRNSGPCYNRDNTLVDKRFEDNMLNDKKPVSKRQILHVRFYEVPDTVKFTETEIDRWFTTAWVRGKIGSHW